MKNISKKIRSNMFYKVNDIIHKSTYDGLFDHLRIDLYHTTPEIDNLYNSLRLAIRDYDD